ncbi:hypothetical protein LguiB_008167 [Lonicera macranthoides]
MLPKSSIRLCIIISRPMDQRMNLNSKRPTIERAMKRQRSHTIWIPLKLAKSTPPLASFSNCSLSFMRILVASKCLRTKEFSLTIVA